MKLLRLPEVMERTRLAKSTIYQHMAQKKFPVPILQGSAAFWVDTEIEAYITRLMEARQGSQPTQPSS